MSTIISQERFYEIGADRRHGKFYGTLEEAAAQRLKVQRYIAKHQSGEAKDLEVVFFVVVDRGGADCFVGMRVIVGAVPVSVPPLAQTIDLASKLTV